MSVSGFPIVRGITYAIMLVVLGVVMAGSGNLFTLDYGLDITQSVGVLEAEICWVNKCSSYKCNALRAHKAFYIFGMILLLVSLLVGFAGGCRKVLMVIFDLLTFVDFALTATIVVLEKSTDSCTESDLSSSVTLKYGFFAIAAAAVIPLIMSCIDCCWSEPVLTTTTIITTPMASVYTPHPQYNPQPVQQMHYVHPANAGYIPPASLQKTSIPESRPEPQGTNIQGDDFNAADLELAE
eukprot:TRINITY_DN1203_c1_g1_i2.p1 TRINITY_DN1203_c1_g1~~TRINITY_DN1203_c1_g1_i2.p1  ORF type:complete len:239 (+),score=61.93 TRINITY_DN1203_c1_g1_i2:66-782(+)